MRLPIRRGEERDSWTSDRMASMRDMIDRFFEDRTWSPAEWLGETPGRALTGWTPKVDVSETEEEFRICANVPGVKPEDVNVELEGNMLVLSGKTSEERVEKGKTWYRMERESGEFRRAFTLPESVNPDSIEATFENGTVDVHMKKKTEGRRRKIELKTPQERSTP